MYAIILIIRSSGYLHIWISKFQSSVKSCKFPISTCCRLSCIICWSCCVRQSLRIPTEPLIPLLPLTCSSGSRSFFLFFLFECLFSRKFCGVVNAFFLHMHCAKCAKNCHLTQKMPHCVTGAKMPNSAMFAKESDFTELKKVHEIYKR